jgi:molybdopterin/thiamine biosynthesis adenylyltransferase
MELTNQHLTRQLDLIPIEVLGEPITVIGAGAIGGWVTLALAKMGFGNISVYDFDHVDIVNLNSQFYRQGDVGGPKVGALRQLVLDFTGTEIDGRYTKYEGGIFPGIVISAVDNMAVRKLIWDNHVGKSVNTRRIIDPRMGAESALLYVMNPMSEVDAKAYEKTLYSDEDAVRERCTAKATIYTANLLSGMVCKAVKDILVGDQYPRTVTWDIKSDQFQAYRGTGT